MLELFLSAIVISSANLIVWDKISGKYLNFKNYRTWIGILFMMISLMLNSVVQPILKITVVLFIFLFTIKIIYGSRLKEALVLSIYSQTIYIISELVVIIGVLFVTNINSNKELVDVFFGTIYANIIISALVVVIVGIPIISKIYSKLLKIIENQKIYNVVITIFTILTTATVILNFLFYRNNLMLLSIIGLMLLCVYIVFVVNNIVIRNNYLNMYTKYNDTLEALKSYEDILDKYKVSNHENKNQLLMIRNMLGKDTKNDVSKYIDRIVENEYKDDENLMMETSKIPAGGLRALIYSKLLYMKNKKISFNLKVDRKIRNVQLIELDESINLDICKVVGVFLDNAIDEIKKSKNGSISLELYMLDERFCISIANTFEGLIDLDKIDTMKYTTKGTGRGYGLALVKEILNKRPQLKNIRTINDNVFIQILKISI